MSKSPVPTPVKRSEVERVCAMGPANGPICERLREQLAEWEEWERERDAEEARIRAAREEREAAAARERSEAREQERAQEVAAVQEGLRQAFFAANPTASEEDWLRLQDRVYDEHLLAQMRQGDGDTRTALARIGSRL